MTTNVVTVAVTDESSRIRVPHVIEPGDAYNGRPLVADGDEQVIYVKSPTVFVQVAPRLDRLRPSKNAGPIVRTWYAVDGMSFVVDRKAEGVIYAWDNNGLVLKLFGKAKSNAGRSTSLV